MFSRTSFNKKYAFSALACVVLLVGISLTQLVNKRADNQQSQPGIASRLQTLEQLLQHDSAEAVDNFLAGLDGSAWLKEEATSLTILPALIHGATQCPTAKIASLQRHRVNLVSEQLGTPLHLLGFFDDVDETLLCIDVLLQAGVNINAVDNQGYTVLTRILYSHHVDTLLILEALVARGANPLLRSKHGLDLMHHALLLRLLYTDLHPCLDDESDELCIEAKRITTLSEQVMQLTSEYFVAQ